MNRTHRRVTGLSHAPGTSRGLPLLGVDLLGTTTEDPPDDRDPRHRRDHVHHPVVRLLVRLKKMMQREGIEFAEVDIEHDDAAADLVMQANGGNRTVPTLVFADGTALTNPSIDQVKSQLNRSPEE